MLLTPAQARAYVNMGRWIAECPAGCGNAQVLKKEQPKFACTECYVIHDVEWPSNAADIWDALQRRPHEKNRNWFPTGHDLAVKAGIPHGQTVKELLDEQEAHERKELESQKFVNSLSDLANLMGE